MFKEKLLLEIQALQERKLVKEIILPLLEEMGFEIEHRHGILERGIDILCIKENELLEKEFTAVQVKKTKFSANIASNNNLYAISNQLNQSLTEPVKLKDGTTRQINRVWFISPYELNGISLESAFQKHIDNYKKNITVIDGDKLYKLMRKYCPQLLMKFGDKQNKYIENFKNETPVLKEAATFGLKEKKYLSQQYVQMHLSPVPEKLINICIGSFEIVCGKYPIRNQYARLVLEEFNTAAKEELGFEPLITNNANNLVFTDSFNPDSFLDIIKQKSNNEIKNFISEIKKGTVKISHLTGFVSHIGKISNLIYNDVFREIASVPNKTKHVYYFDISIEQILLSRLNYQIIADAGAGKTTLLRMIGLSEVNKFSGRLPVFIALANYKENQRFTDLIISSCNALGMNFTTSEIQSYLEKGNILLLLDGLDEVSSKTTAIQTEILKKLSEYKNTQFIFTGRPWSAIPHNDNFTTISILPFTKNQVKLFFNNWFRDEKHHAKEIIKHLEVNKHLYQVVSTPLIATIIAAIKTHGGKLPKDLITVYSERLRLLLNDWDNIKGVKRDVFEVEDKKFFIRKLAYNLHTRHIRSIGLEHIEAMALELVGNITTGDKARAFVMELINNNNILFKDDFENWGFGHLQYQEYLAALELKENHSLNKARYLNVGWWGKVLENYAYMTRDISEIINDARSSSSEIDRFVYSIFKLLTKAPNTDKALKNYIVSLKEQNMVDFATEFEDDNEDYIIEYNDQALKLLWETKDSKGKR